MTTQSAQRDYPTHPSATSRDWLYIASIVLTLIGIGIAGYLSYTKIADVQVACVETSSLDCNAVQSSIYSQVMGIDVAYLGLAAYLTFFAILVLEPYIGLLQTYSRTLMFSLTLFGVAYSGYLTYIEAFVLETWCQWCVGSALVMLGLFIVSTVRAYTWVEIDEDIDE